MLSHKDTKDTKSFDKIVKTKMIAFVSFVPLCENKKGARKR